MRAAKRGPAENIAATTTEDRLAVGALTEIAAALGIARRAKAETRAAVFHRAGAWVSAEASRGMAETIIEAAMAEVVHLAGIPVALLAASIDPPEPILTSFSPLFSPAKARKLHPS